MTKYRITHKGGDFGSNIITSTFGGILDAVLRALEYGGTATVSEIIEDTEQDDEAK